MAVHFGPGSVLTTNDCALHTRISMVCFQEYHLWNAEEGRRSTNACYAVSYREANAQVRKGYKTQWRDKRDIQITFDVSRSKVGRHKIRHIVKHTTRRVLHRATVRALVMKKHPNSIRRNVLFGQCSLQTVNKVEPSTRPNDPSHSPQCTARVVGD